MTGRLTRRNALKAAAAVGGSVLAYKSVDEWRRLPPDTVEDFEFVWVGGEEVEDHAYEHPDHDGYFPADMYEGPKFEVDRSNRLVKVDGVLNWGFNDCYNKEFWGFEGDGEEVRAVVRAYRPVSSMTKLGCTAVAFVSPYRLSVWFDRFPQRFAVEERFRDEVTDEVLRI